MLPAGTRSAYVDQRGKNKWLVGGLQRAVAQCAVETGPGINVDLRENVMLEKWMSSILRG